MKAKINEDGVLEIIPKTTTETYALIAWLKRNLVKEVAQLKPSSVIFDLSDDDLKLFDIM
jgi:hypothetical protein